MQWLPWLRPLRKQYRERNRIPVSAEAIYRVVMDVPAYSSFVPYCKETKIMSSSENTMQAMMTIGFQWWTVQYLSTISMKRGQYVNITASPSSAFSHLESLWKFKHVDDKTCDVDFQVDFQVQSQIHGAAIEVFFDQVVSAQMHAFIHETQRRQKVSDDNIKKIKKKQSVEGPVVRIAKKPQPQQQLMELPLEPKHRALHALFHQHADNDDQLSLSVFLKHVCPALTSLTPSFAKCSSLVHHLAFLHMDRHQQGKLSYETFYKGLSLLENGTHEDSCTYIFDTIIANKTSSSSSSSRNKSCITRTLLQESFTRRILLLRTFYPHVATTSSFTKAMEKRLEDMETQIPFVVNGLFQEGDLELQGQLSYIAWKRLLPFHPELYDLFSIKGMQHIIEWISTIQQEKIQK